MNVTFLGTKGGTGTTTLAVNAAAELRRHSGRSTVIVDLKAGFGDVALFLGLRPRLSLLDLIDQRSWTERALVARFVTEHECGVHVLAAGEDFSRPMPRDAEGVEGTLRALSTMYDFVVVDAGSALAEWATLALRLSSVALLVTNPDVPCLRHLQRLTDAVRLAGVPSERIRVVLNRASERGALSTGQIQHVLGRTIDFSLTSDYRTVAAAVNGGVPIAALRSSELQTQLRALARSLALGDMAAL